MNLIAFDLEGDLIPEDWDKKSELAITCATAYVEIQTTGGLCKGHAVWWAGMGTEEYDSCGVDGITADIESGKLPTNQKMTPEEIERMLDDLINLLNKPIAEPVGGSPILVAWNSTGYDFPCIASNVPHRLNDIVAMAKKSLDPCFQFVQTLGWPIGLDKIAKVMLGHGKTEGMDGVKAAMIWPLDAEKVIRYCLNDSIVTAEVVKAMMEERRVRWVKKNGDIGERSLDRWLPVGTAMKLPEPNRDWMKDHDGRYDLERYIDWME